MVRAALTDNDLKVRTSGWDMFWVHRDRLAYLNPSARELRAGLGALGSYKAQRHEAGGEELAGQHCGWFRRQSEKSWLRSSFRIVLRTLEAGEDVPTFQRLLLYIFWLLTCRVILTIVI